MRRFKKRPNRVFIDKNKSPYFKINGKKVKILTKYNHGQLANKIINNYYQEKKKRRTVNKKKSSNSGKLASSSSSSSSGIFSKQVEQNIKALETDNKIKVMELESKKIDNNQKQMLIEDVKKNAIAANMLLTNPELSEKFIKMTPEQFDFGMKKIKKMEDDLKQKIMENQKITEANIKQNELNAKLKEEKKKNKFDIFTANRNKNIFKDPEVIQNLANTFSISNKYSKNPDQIKYLEELHKFDPTAFNLNRKKKIPVSGNKPNTLILYEIEKAIDEYEPGAFKSFLSKPDFAKNVDSFVEKAIEGKYKKPKKEKLPQPEEINNEVQLFPEYKNPNPPINLNKIEVDDPIDPLQIANGLHDGKKGLYNTDIEEIIKMVGKDNKRLKQSWKGVYSIDEIDELTKSIKKDDRYISFVLNLDPSDQPGSHWVSCWIDVYKRREICYYDSFGKIYPPRFLKDISLVIEKLKPTYYLMLKYNKIKYQSVSSSNCGWFAIKFLFDMANKAEFKECTGYNSLVEKSENDINKYKDKIINKLI